MRRVAITGLGIVSPVGIGQDAFWQGLLRPQPSGERRVHDFDPTRVYDDPKAIRRADRFEQFAIAAAKEALAQSGPAAQAPSEPAPTARPVAPPTPAAATSTSAQPADGAPPISDSEFKQATDRISEDAKSLSFLSHARPLVFEHSRLVLGHTDFNLQWAQAKAAEIQSKYSAEFKRPVQIEHKLDTTDAGSRKSLVEDKEQALLEARARRRREAVEHPARGLVREVFGDVSFLEPTLEPEVNLHG